jgi:hypothetical protein
MTPLTLRAHNKEINKPHTGNNAFDERFMGTIKQAALVSLNVYRTRHDLGELKALCQSEGYEQGNFMKNT